MEFFPEVTIELKPTDQIDTEVVYRVKYLRTCPVCAE